MSEQVLVIPTALAQELAPNVYGPVPSDAEIRILAACSFLEREAAETSFEFKQVIPYIVVGHSSAKWLLARRTAQQQERRLHNLYSIGQGGHVNDLDFGAPGSPIIAGLRREINEEFKLGEVTNCAAVSLINDNSNEVGRVHLGIVYTMLVADLTLHVAEDGKHTAEWANTARLRECYSQMENWSKILMDVMDPPPRL